MQTALWILRISVFGTFFGHGMGALMGNEHWLPYLGLVGIQGPIALKTMFAIGVLDMLVAFSTLVKPSRYVLIYAFTWAFCTALARPLAAEPWLEFVERVANWATPLALYVLLYWKSRGDRI